MAYEQVLRTVPMHLTLMASREDGRRVLYLIVPSADANSAKFPAVGSSYPLESSFIYRYSQDKDQMVWVLEGDVDKVLARAEISRSGDVLNYTISYVEPGYELPDVQL